MSLKYSEQFTNILSRISHNKISNHLLSIPFISDNDFHLFNFKFNYIDITDSKGLVSYTPTDKIEKLLQSIPDVYIINGDRFLTNSDSNDSIFTRLGYDKYSSLSNWRPDYDCYDEDEEGRPEFKVVILCEAVSNITGKTYAKILFDDCGYSRYAVINKECLTMSKKDSKIWTMNRNNIKIGRLVSSLLSTEFTKFPTFGVEFINKDIEEFVNLYKASYDFINNDNQFNIVKGDDIAFWYKQENYASGKGILSNSCMCHKPSDYFDVYSKNVNQCSLVILYSDSGKLLLDGSYTSDKIKGRALLWDVIVDGKAIKFLDRIYTNQDSDIQLFIQYAHKNGWYYKSEQSMYPDCDKINKNGDILPNLYIKLEYSLHDRYPYMDTMCYMAGGLLTNEYNRDKMSQDGKEFRNTDGSYCYHGKVDGGDYQYPDDEEGYDVIECEAPEPSDPNEVSAEVSTEVVGVAALAINGTNGVTSVNHGYNPHTFAPNNAVNAMAYTAYLSEMAERVRSRNAVESNED